MPMSSTTPDTHLLQVHSKEPKDKPSIEQGESVMDKESEVNVEVGCILAVPDVGLGYLLSELLHEDLQVTEEVLRETILPRQNELSAHFQVLCHSLHLMGHGSRDQINTSKRLPLVRDDFTCSEREHWTCEHAHAMRHVQVTAQVPCGVLEWT